MIPKAKVSLTEWVESTSEGEVGGFLRRECIEPTLPFQYKLSGRKSNLQLSFSLVFEGRGWPIVGGCGLAWDSVYSSGAEDSQLSLCEARGWGDKALY